MARRPDIEAIIRADTRQFDGAMRTIRDEVDKTGNAALGRFGAFGNVVASASSKLTLMGGAVAGVSALLVGFARAAKQASDGVLEINDMASRSNVSFQAFQELQYAAAQANVPVDALADGLYELNLRAAEYVQTAGGPAKEAFQRLGLSPDQVRQQLEDPAAFLELIIDRVRTLDGATARFTLDEIFAGTAAERFVNLLDQSQGEMSALRDEARDVGVVMDDDLLATAQEINQRWEEMSLIVSSRVKGAVLSVADAMLSVIRRGAELNAQLDRMAQQNEGRAKAISRRADRHGADRPGVVAEFERLDAATGDSATQQLLRYGNALGQLTSHFSNPSSFTPIVEPEKEKKAGSSQKRDPAIVAAERHAKAIQNVVEALEFEFELVGKSEEQKRIMTELRRADVEASSEQGQNIAALVSQIQAEEARIEALNADLEKSQQVSAFFGQTIEDAFSSAVPAIETGNQALDRFLNTLIEAVAQAALFGSGPLGGVFGGGIFGAGSQPSASAVAAAAQGIGGLFANGAAFSAGSVVPFAHGGVVSSATAFPMAGGQTGVMGEAGPEAIMPLSRMPNGKLGVASGSKAGSGMQVNNQIINKNGSQISTEQQREPDGSLTNRFIIGTVKKGMMNGQLDRPMAAFGSNLKSVVR